MVKLPNVQKTAKRHIEFYKHYCMPKSTCFSSSEAYIHGYINPVNNSWCYYDKLAIFFFGPLDRSVYFVACPKGRQWEEKIFKVIYQLQAKAKIKQFKLVELSSKLSGSFWQDELIKKIEYLPRIRHLSSLAEFKNTENYCLDKPKIRKKVKNFNNRLNEVYPGHKIENKTLSRATFSDAKNVLKEWEVLHSNKTTQHSQGQITVAHINNKNLCLIHQAIKQPQKYESLIMYVYNKPIGIILGFLVEKSNVVCGSILCVNKDIPNTSCMLCLLFLEMLARKGYSFINWGNSFSENIENFKQQFMPTEQERAHEYMINFS